MCGYRAMIHHPAGCPTQCTVGSNGMPCSEQGVCGYDTVLNAAACLCNSGWYGSDCSQPMSVNYGGRAAGAFFGGLALGGSARTKLWCHYVHTLTAAAAAGAVIVVGWIFYKKRGGTATGVKSDGAWRPACWRVHVRVWQLVSPCRPQLTATMLPRSIEGVWRSMGCCVCVCVLMMMMLAVVVQWKMGFLFFLPFSCCRVGGVLSLCATHRTNRHCRFFTKFASPTLDPYNTCHVYLLLSKKNTSKGVWPTSQ